ncbi:unnamed protein product [Brassica rapa]|uniref:Translation elongation factor EF1B beta/delta subunit guanine nucleotide exchange domain-containing protein n=2 Tax=Brassica campestris TaxID=3711 RepID=A0A8D9GAJ4_BRACM|nr:unnamed protein product [Brassica rapa]
MNYCRVLSESTKVFFFVFVLVTFFSIQYFFVRSFFFVDWISCLISVKKIRASETMAAFPNPNSNAGLKKLDEHLLTRYYITGHKASKDDITVYAALSKHPPSQYVNVSRWYNHIETLLGISGISCQGSGVSIDGLVSTSEHAVAGSNDGVAVVDNDKDVDQDVDLIREDTQKEKKSAEERATSTKKKICWESVLIVIIPQDCQTNMKKLEERLRTIQMEGLIWGASKLVHVGYGVELLRIIATMPRNEKIDVFDVLVGDYISFLGRFNVATAGLHQSLVLINPNDEETDMKKLEETVRSIQVAGLFWGASKLVSIGYGIKLLGIECTAVGHLAHLGRRVGFNTIFKEKIMDHPYVQSCQTLSLNIISGKSGLVLRKLFGDNPDIKKTEETVRSGQMEGVVWGASKIYNVGYGFKYMRTIFTIVDDQLSLDTVTRNTGGIPLNRICKRQKPFLNSLKLLM